MTQTANEQMKALTDMLAPYAQSSVPRSVFQLLNSAILFFGTWYLMFRSLEISYWLTLLLAIPASGFLIRLFIIQHDCGHSSFFPSQRANDMVGFLIGVLTLTPYHYWRKNHAIHHATSGNLDQRDIGDVTTLTVKEYLALSLWRKFCYRIYRNPFFLFGFGALYLFVIKHRFPWDVPWSWRREWASVMKTNLAIVAVIALMWKLIGLKAFLMVQVPITLISGTMGVWLFYIQHQFEDTYWENEPDWSFKDASLQGSSYYDLPRFLHWFTGNIGVHHIHHLASRIPNYRLRQCLRENPVFQRVTHLRFLESLKCTRLNLWDEESKKLVGFRNLRSIQSNS